jgi:hypothetical protein
MSDESPTLDTSNPRGFAWGNDTINPFTPPRQIQANANSVIGMLLTIQRKRMEPQTMVEVGVWQGQDARWLLVCLPRLTLHLVDPFQAPKPGDSWHDQGDKFAKRPQQQHEIHFRMVTDLCKQFAPRAILHRQYSVEAATKFADRSLDLVFIDAAHDYANVKADIEAWHGKVRPGGWLSGHDYKPSGIGKYGRNVGRAVDEFAKVNGHTVQVFPGKCWAIRTPKAAA